MGVLDNIKTATVDGLKKTATNTSKAVFNSSNRAIESVISKTTAAVGSKVSDAILKDLSSPPKTAPAPKTAVPPESAASAKAAALVEPKAEPKQLSPAELEAIIEARVRAKGISSNWKVSIFDLMNAFDMNSGLDACKALAVKLNYFGYDADGSPEKNAWLHSELLKALAKNGGEVPPNLL